MRSSQSLPTNFVTRWVVIGCSITLCNDDVRITTQLRLVYIEAFTPVPLSMNCIPFLLVPRIWEPRLYNVHTKGHKIRSVRPSQNSLFPQSSFPLLPKETQTLFTTLKVARRTYFDRSTVIFRYRFRLDVWLQFPIQIFLNERTKIIHSTKLIRTLISPHDCLRVCVPLAADNV